MVVPVARWLAIPVFVLRNHGGKGLRETSLALVVVPARMAYDVDGNPVYLATNRYNLQLLMEKWPKVQFHASREHGQRFD